MFKVKVGANGGRGNVEKAREEIEENGRKQVMEVGRQRGILRVEKIVCVLCIVVVYLWL